MCGDSASIKRLNQPPSILEMGEGWFWSRDVIGGTPEDVAACERGELSSQRQEELAAAGIAAMRKLEEMEVPGVRDWMPLLRRLN